jgi:type IX secretion system PorP/SprF family membrane protein
MMQIRKYWKFKVAMLLFLLNAGPGIAQDLHFSQFFNSPLTTNPANTGFIPTSDYRLGAHYRDQWSNSFVPYKTLSVSGDFQFLRNKFPSGWMGLGGMILQDVAGAGSLRSTKVYMSTAYHQMIGVAGLLSAGFNLGYASKNINISKMTFGDQWNGRFFDQKIGSLDLNNIINNSVGYFDMQVGMNYAYFPTDNIYFHTGFSVHHVNRPRESFFADANGYDNRIAQRSIFFADAMIKMNDWVILSPSLYYTTQAKASEFVVGMHLNYNLANAGDQQLLAGVYMRTRESVIPMLGYQWKNFKFTFSYDVSKSSLQYTNPGLASSELYMQYDGTYTPNYGAGKQSLCPTFKN